MILRFFFFSSSVCIGLFLAWVWYKDEVSLARMLSVKKKKKKNPSGRQNMCIGSAVKLLLTIHHVKVNFSGSSTWNSQGRCRFNFDWLWWSLEIACYFIFFSLFSRRAPIGKYYGWLTVQVNALTAPVFCCHCVRLLILTEATPSNILEGKQVCNQKSDKSAVKWLRRGWIGMRTWFLLPCPETILSCSNN